MNESPPKQLPERTATSASEIRDLHIGQVTATFELANAYAKSRESNESIWKAHCKVNFAWASPRSIARLIRMHVAFRNHADAIPNFELDALFALAEPGAETARKQAVAEAMAGRYVTADDAKNLIAVNKNRSSK